MGNEFCVNLKLENPGKLVLIPGDAELRIGSKMVPASELKSFCAEDPLAAAYSAAQYVDKKLKTGEGWQLATFWANFQDVLERKILLATEKERPSYAPNTDMRLDLSTNPTWGAFK